MLELNILPFNYNSLEPYIDCQTVEIHYSKHHKTYLDNLNKLIAVNAPLADLSLDQIIAKVNQLDIDLQRPVINNAGQVYNHNKYWESLSGDFDQTPSITFLNKINKKFTNLDNFKAEWKKAGLSQFGSGWVFLINNSDNELEIVKTANGDSPIFRGITPLLTMDVWEHAYYLKYQNKRADYIDNYFRVINWSKIV